MTKFRKDNPQRVEPEPQPDAPPSKAKVTEVYQALLTMEERGAGDRRIARECGVSLHWVRQILAEMNAAKATLYS